MMKSFVFALNIYEFCTISNHSTVHLLLAHGANYSLSFLSGFNRLKLAIILYFTLLRCKKRNTCGSN